MVNTAVGVGTKKHCADKPTKSGKNGGGRPVLETLSDPVKRHSTEDHHLIEDHHQPSLSQDDKLLIHHSPPDDKCPTVDDDVEMAEVEEMVATLTPEQVPVLPCCAFFLFRPPML